MHTATQLGAHRQMSWAPVAKPMITPRQLRGEAVRHDLLASS